MTWLEIYIVAVVHVGGVFAVAYPVLWAHYADWRGNRIGRAFMFIARALAALYAVSILHFWWPYPGWPFIYAGVLTLLAVGLARQAFALARTFRGGPKNAE